jgi:four helix bundle suffix protein
MLRPHGGYRQLRSFQVAEIVYDGTVAFWDRFIDKRSRTHDQMVQAARSGRQNIAEGSRASGTSSQTELRLVGVARASLDELLLDYEDFLRQKCLTIWAKDDPRALKVRAIGHSGSGLSHPSSPTDRPDPTGLSNRMASPGNPPATPYSLYRTLVEDSPPETAANTLICLIHQANYLLDRQLQELERQFIQGGGYTEQLAAARRDERDRQSGRVSHRADRTDPTDPSAAPTPACPKCGQPMVLRTARKGPRAGSQFWGCRGYPDCTGTLPKK